MAAADKPPADGSLEIDLRHPGLAALLAWLWPGAGHLYQRRYAKGVLFMVCVLSLYFFGLSLAGGRSVYANWEPNDHRWQYFLQLGVGGPSLPAAVQWYRVRQGDAPLWGGFMAPPTPVIADDPDELAKLHEVYGNNYDLGVLYTVIAGLLNILAIYDAFAGPVMSVPETDQDDEPDEEPAPAPPAKNA